jgi:hypothetical protein
MHLYKGGREKFDNRREDSNVTTEAKCYAASFEDGGRVHKPSNARM